MKIECLKNKLKNIISIAEKVTAKNHSLPILNLIILETDQGGLKIRSTNLEVGLEAQVPAKVNLEGRVAVNAQILNQLLNFSTRTDDKVTLEVKEGSLLIKSDRSETNLKVYPPDDFPLIPKVNNGVKFNLPTTDFILGIKSVIYSSATSDIKPEISSVYIYQKEDKLYFVSTDSFRLAEKNINFNHQGTIPPIIIPLRNILEIMKALEGEGGELGVVVSENQIAFSTDNLYLTSRVINSTFPDYKQIIPKQFKTEVEIDKEELLNNLRLSNIFTDKFNQINFNIRPSEGVFEINSKNQEVGENRVNSKAEVKGEEVNINLNARYIIESLPSFNSSKINLLFTEKNKPLLVTSPNDPSFQYLVMPINR